MKFYSLFFIFLFLNADYPLYHSITFQSGTEWELKKDKNNIKVFVRDSARSGIKEIRVITTVKASVEELVEIVYDIDSYPLWIANLETAEILETVSKREIYYYYQADVPWPFKNRDDVMRFVMEENPDNGSATIKFTGHPDYIPEKDKIVRLSLNKGHWKFTPVLNGETEIDYLFFTDEGKGYPNWLVNMFVVDGPFEMVSNLKGLVNKHK
jgi:hypothetical protein